MPRDPRAILSACKLLCHVRGPAQERLVGMSRRQSFTRGERVFKEGDACPGVYIVDSGLVRVFKIAPNGKEHVLHLVSPGATFAEVAAIGGFPCPAHAEALADTIREGYQNRQYWNDEHSRLRDYSIERSSEKAVLGNWEQLIDSV